MSQTAIKTTEEIVSCSDNGQHPLVYISLKNGSGRCHYCGQLFIRKDVKSEQNQQAA
ncbi:MAG: zinc-finger domain-containing protein [Zetaproteobacteria bacterium]|nr:MAG: zinc-finger domain-containing protein [Zetaproteobacteria bacterium]